MIAVAEHSRARMFLFCYGSPLSTLQRPFLVDESEYLMMSAVTMSMFESIYQLVQPLKMRTKQLSKCYCFLLQQQQNMPLARETTPQPVVCSVMTMMMNRLRKSTSMLSQMLLHREPAAD